MVKKGVVAQITGVTTLYIYLRINEKNGKKKKLLKNFF